MFRVFCKTDGVATLATVFLVAMATLSAPAPVGAYTFDDVTVTYWAGADPGDGVGEALMVVDWQIPGKDSLVFGYRWTDDDKGIHMLTAISNADNRFYLEWHPFYPGAVYGIGWDADGDGFDKADADDYYAEGWLFGSWRYYLSTDAQEWTYSGSGAGDRILSDGDWDGWSWAPGSDVSVPNDLPLTTVIVDVPGDSNGDDVVDDLDYDNFIAQFGGAPGANSADFNDDDVVDLADFAILRENFGAGVASAPDIASVGEAPEPAVLTILVMGGSALLARRRR
ncbi:MAG: hypothetical protein QGG42_02390 [Phycisphaerae bacterium]|jgi:hypothetical protein|nr:hypothetical protein [Phycisphaerae bacterium]